MPRLITNKKLSVVGPTIDLLKRMLGSNPDEPFLPEMEEGIRIARKENPKIGNVKSYPKNSGLGEMGNTSLSNSISLNQSQKGHSSQDWADVITHEQEHVNQQSKESFGPAGLLLKRMYERFLGPNLPYSQQPDELGAFQAEKDRRSRMGRRQVPLPSFSNPGKYYYSNDINLPVEKRK